MIKRYRARATGHRLSGANEASEPNRRVEPAASDHAIQPRRQTMPTGVPELIDADRFVTLGGIAGRQRRSQPLHLSRCDVILDAPPECWYG